MEDRNSSAGAGGAGGGKPGEAASKKRARYTSVACNECKRRKIKCNGEKPCERCGNQGLECVYASNEFQNSEEYRRMTEDIATLQAQVRELHDTVNRLLLAGSGPKPGNHYDSIHDSMDLHSKASKSAPGADGMDVDMSRNGRVLFVQSPGDGSSNSESDPLLAIDSSDIRRLLSLYTTHIHVAYPFLDIGDIMWRVSNLLDFRDAAQRNEVGYMFSGSEDALFDPSALATKMALAVTAFCEDPQSSRLSERIYENVQDIYKNRGHPVGYALQHTMTGDDSRESRDAIMKGIRLRICEALWQFHHGEDEKALAEITDVRVVFQTYLMASLHSNEEDPPDVLDTCRKLGEVIYSIYWRWTILLKTAPRRDAAVEKVPLRKLENDFDSDGDKTLRGPFFEYAKLCSLTTFTFEGPEESFHLLDVIQPPWTKDMMVGHVHRWQGHFGNGLRSLSILRPQTLALKSTAEQVMLSLIYLHANCLRLEMCRYKRSSSGDRYSGAVTEYWDSSKYAQESLMILWEVHQAGKVWHIHMALYNHFLAQAGDWLYMLLSSKQILLTNEVKNALEQALGLLEAHASDWPRTEVLLQRLRESRKHNVIGSPG